MMKFVVKSKELLTQAVAASKVINAKVAVQILSNLRFEVADGSMCAVGSDGENVVKTSLPLISNEGAGAICVDTKRMCDLLRAMPDCELTFEVEDSGAMTISHSTGKYSLVGNDASLYPLPQAEGEDDVVFDLPAPILLAAFDRVAFAVSEDMLRPAMCGIYWDIAAEGITFVATDTRVLATFEHCKEVGVADPYNFILPTKAIGLLRTLLGKEASVKVQANAKRIIFRGDSFTLTSPRVLGRFPDYKRVIPQNNNNTATIDRQEMINAIGRVDICSDQQNRMLRVDLQPAGIKLSAKDENFCVAASESISCTLDGEQTAIGLSAFYLKEILSAMPSQEVMLRYSDPARPVIVTPLADAENTKTMTLIMPINLR